MISSLPPRLAIDAHVSAEQSVVLRYAPAIASDQLSQEDLAATSQREGARLIELPSYRGVQLFVLDESTGMRTGTYKSLDGCIGTAMCRRQGVRRAVFSSGANAGIALTDYAARTGLETFFFCPASTLYKLDADLCRRPSAHLIAVDGPDRCVKEAARHFAGLLQVPVIPSLEWRMISASCRGLFLAEQIRATVRRFSWFVQTVCAAYGPIGIYRTLHDRAAKGWLDPAAIPRFLGVQQAGLSPLVDAWAVRQTVLPPMTSSAWMEEAIEPTLYNMHPAETYPSLCDVLNRSGGDLMAVKAVEFRQRLDGFVRLLLEVGIVPTQVCMGGQSTYQEKAGLLAGVATLKSIDDGRIHPGEAAICAFTGGAGPAPREPAAPELVIAADAELGPQVERYAETIARDQRVAPCESTRRS
ncbi:MAG: pyridoxal-phosphate dependent enzyme [Gemmataceae bacterium]|nr:pyridoxal-phosphate dependent enzyme [Gemmataceae bacterium]